MTEWKTLFPMSKTGNGIISRTFKSSTIMGKDYKQAVYQRGNPKV